MTDIFPWVLLTLTLAAVLHFAGLWYLPRYVSARTVNRILRTRNWKMNMLGNMGLRYAGSDPLPYANPDTALLIGAYDISRTAVRIHCVVPPWDGYWSISLYAWNTDNFLVVNDRTIKSREFDLVIVQSDNRSETPGTEEVVVSPTNKGVVLLRTVVTDRQNEDELARINEIQRRTILELATGTAR